MPSVFHNPARPGFYSRVFAALYDPLTAGADRGVLANYRQYVAGKAHGRVLEVGAGTGANLHHYHHSVTLTVTDRNPHMLRRLQCKANSLGLQPKVVVSGVEELPFPDASYETVVSTMLLCSVRDTGKAIGEITRVLTPGGELRFLEHVRANSFTWAMLQDAASPLWSLVADGCHPNRSTLSAIKGSGLDLVQVRTFQAGPYPVRPWIAGVARKRP